MRKIVPGKQPDVMLGLPTEDTEGPQSEDWEKQRKRILSDLEGPITEHPPTIDDEPWQVEGRTILYSDRAPWEFVVSGPIREYSTRPGKPWEREFATLERATRWVNKNYRDCVPRLIEDAVAGGRWAYVVSTPQSRALHEAREIAKAFTDKEWSNE